MSEQPPPETACGGSELRRSGSVTASPDEPEVRARRPSDPQAVVDLLGVLAYGQLTAFDRLSNDARFAPTIETRITLATLAAGEVEQFHRLRAHLSGMGVDPGVAMGPFIRPIDAYHQSTRPGTWLESLVKAYVGDGIAADFYREIAEYLDPATRDLVLSVLGNSGPADFAVREVRAAISADGRVASRLSLWARRLVGEALSQAQRVSGERPALTALVVGGSGDPAAVSDVFRRLTDGHTARMRTIGLSS
ncbi:MAG: ferritin-like fold-containing protein [Mycobacteriales bacterium]